MKKDQNIWIQKQMNINNITEYENNIKIKVVRYSQIICNLKTRNNILT